MIAEAFSWMVPRAMAATTPGPLDPFWYGPVGRRSSAGVTISDQNALAVSAFWDCLRILAEDVAGLPAMIYHRLPNGGKERATGHPLYRLLHDQPNAWQTSFEWREQMMAHLCLRGIFYNRLIFGLGGRIEQIIPLNPDRVQPEQLPSGRMRYRYQRPGAAPETYVQDEMFIVRGLSLDGINPLSILGYAKNSLGLAIAQESHGAGQFENGALPPFWIKWAGNLTEDRKKNFRAGWRAMHGGAENASNPPILDGGNTLESLAINNEEAQWLESREFQGEDICRFFRMQPHKAGYMKKATFSNIEEQGIDYSVSTLRPWLVRIEHCAKRDLFDDDEYFLEFLIDGQLRGNLAARTDALSKQFLNGALTLDQWCEIENRNPLPDGQGQRHFVPLNLVPIEEAGGKFTAAGGAVEGGQEGPQALNGAQISAAIDVMVKLREKTIQPDAAVELLAGIGIDRARAQAIVSSTPLGLDSTAGDVAFKREILKQLLSVPAAREAVYNSVDINDLVTRTGLAVENGYQAPWIPVIAPAGQQVSGEVIKDPEGAIVGGDVVEGEAEGGTGGKEGGTGGNGGNGGDGGGEAQRGDAGTQSGKQDQGTGEEGSADAGGSGGDSSSSPVTGQGGDQAAGKQNALTPDPSPASGRGERSTRHSVLGTLLADAAERLAAAEIRGLSTRAEKAAGDRRRWIDWATGFYEAHQAYAARVLQPIAKVSAELGRPVDANLAAVAVVQPIGPVFDVECDVPALLAERRGTRAEQLQGILQEAFFGKGPE